MEETIQTDVERDKAVGRRLVVLTALLWSTGGLFAKAPVFDSWRGDPSAGALIAFWRTLFAGVLLLSAVRRPRLRIEMLPMTCSFAVMNVTYLSAMIWTTAANAIWLQSTAPLWVFLVGVFLWREPIIGRDLIPLAFGGAGVGVILFYELTAEAGSTAGIVCGLVSGVAYAWVVVSLRRMRGEDGAWLTALNHLFTAAVLGPYVFWFQEIRPSPAQLGVLAAFGILQMGIPYLIFSRALGRIPGQEAAAIALLEPVLLPLWVFLVWSESPHWWTLAGAGLILTGLALRYLRPSRNTSKGDG